MKIKRISFVLVILVSSFAACVVPDYSDFSQINNYALLDLGVTNSTSATPQEIISFPITISGWTKTTSPIQFNLDGGTSPLAYLLEDEYGDVLVIPFWYTEDRDPSVASSINLVDFEAEWEIEEESEVIKDGSISVSLFAFGNIIYRPFEYINTGFVENQLGFFVYSLDNSNSNSLRTHLKNHYESKQADYTGTEETTVTLSTTLVVTESEGFTQPFGSLIANQVSFTGSTCNITYQNSSESSVKLLSLLDNDKNTSNNIISLFEKKDDNGVIEYIPKFMRVLTSENDNFPTETTIEAQGEVTLSTEIEESTLSKMTFSHALVLSAFDDILE